MAETDPTRESAGRSPAAIGLFVGVLVALLVADLLIKYAAFAWMGPEPIDVHAVLNGREGIPDETVTLLPYTLALKLTLNPGAVFGLWAGYRWMFVVATIVAVGVVGYFFYSSGRRERMVHVALAAILAGALGNLYDRLVYGVVRDMFWLFPGVELPFGLHWPGGSPYLYPWLFNLADACLLLGIGVILVRSIVMDIRQARQKKA